MKQYAVMAMCCSAEARTNCSLTTVTFERSMKYGLRSKVQKVRKYRCTPTYANDGQYLG